MRSGLPRRNDALAAALSAASMLTRAPELDLGRMERNLSSMIEQIDHAGAAVGDRPTASRAGETIDLRPYQYEIPGASSRLDYTCLLLADLASELAGAIGPMTTPIVYVVDDQPAVCHGLREMLSVLGYEVETFGSAQQFLKTLDASRPGCLVADAQMPGMDGLGLMQELTRRSIRLPVVLISGRASVSMAVAAIKAGAEDIIEKPINDAQLIAAINRCLAQAFERLSNRRSIEDLERRFDTLTPREKEVFDLVSEGCTSVEIASRLKLSTRTVESYRVQIMEKIQAESVAMLVRHAIRLGRLQP